MRNTIYGLISLSLVACTDHPYDPSGPAIDPNAPVIEITTPTRGTIAGDVQSVTVTGTSSDDNGVASVTVNGVAATLATDGSWTATVPVTVAPLEIQECGRDARVHASSQQRFDVPHQFLRLLGRRVAPHHIARLVDEELGEIPFDRARSEQTFGGAFQ